MHAAIPIRSILVLGGTTTIGKQVVKQALDMGLLVTVLISQPEKMNGLSSHAHLEILKGDVLHYPDVYNAVQGNDAIISVVGHEEKNTNLITQGTTNIIRAIAQSSVLKLICLSSLGAGSTRKLAGWQLKWMIRLSGLRQVFEAKAEQEILLYQSSLNFTLVMALPPTSHIKYIQSQAYAVVDLPCMIASPPKISYQAVASFIIEQLTSDIWKRKTVCLLGEE